MEVYRSKMTSKGQITIARKYELPLITNDREIIRQGK